MVLFRGRVLASSHAFRGSDGWQSYWQCWVEACNNGGSHLLLVKGDKLQEWHQKLEVNACYDFTSMLRDTIDVGGQPMNVLTTSCKSMLITMESKVVGKKTSYKETQPDIFLSCKSEVAEVLDEEAGIYLLSNGMKLYITFLKDVTGELWNGQMPRHEGEGMEACTSPPAKKPKTLSPSRNSNIYKCLAVGDSIKILNCHHLKEETGEALVCCGQTLIVNKSRKFALNTRSGEQEVPLITEWVQTLNLNFKGLAWLIALKGQLSTLLPARVTQEAATHSRESDAAVSCLLSPLLKAAEQRCMVGEGKARCLVQDFLAPVHQCGVTQDFVAPFKLVQLKDIYHEQTKRTSIRPSTQDQTSGTWIPSYQENRSERWRYAITTLKEPSVLVGVVELGKGGVLQIVQRDFTMDLVLVGESGMTLTQHGYTVALVDYLVVKERFHDKNRMDVDIDKVYIVGRYSDLVVLEKPETQRPLSRESSSGRRSYVLRLITKSAMGVVNTAVSPPSPCSHEKFFIGMADIVKADSDGKYVDTRRSLGVEGVTWRRYVKFTGENASLYPLLDYGDELELVGMPDTPDPEHFIKRIDACHWLDTYSTIINVIELPPGTRLVKRSCEERKYWNEFSVDSAVQVSWQVVTVKGILTGKVFVVPTYPSDTSILPHNLCSKCHVGVPHGLQFRLDITDERDSNIKMCLYVSCLAFNVNNVYPLFAIPGLKIIATDLKRHISRSTNLVYFKSTNFTRIIIHSIPEFKKTEKALSNAPDPGPTDLTAPDTSPATGPTTGQARQSACVPATHLTGQARQSASLYLPLRSVPLLPSEFIIIASVIKIRCASVGVVCAACGNTLAHCTESCVRCSKKDLAKIIASAEVEVHDGTGTTARILLQGIRQLGNLFNLPGKDYIKLCSMVTVQCLQMNYAASRPECDQPENLRYETSKLFRQMITSGRLFYSYKITCQKRPSNTHLCSDISVVRPVKDRFVFPKYKARL